ncbi:hypothetical protein E4U02_12445 [Microbacterium paludicola]|uniref:Uncharacterized protein n=1 Tax=Microbacterium paludicola TaxID=300019 RepID=A0A4Y9FUX8_9MICO|nr:hypothetical protein [Microbacterium paludicola]TFU32028.1 hypothetical protein E4U02_12445 [Microbacterium paludicola]
MTAAHSGRFSGNRSATGGGGIATPTSLLPAARTRSL